MSCPSAMLSLAGCWGIAAAEKPDPDHMATTWVLGCLPSVMGDRTPGCPPDLQSPLALAPLSSVFRVWACSSTNVLTTCCVGCAALHEVRSQGYFEGAQRPHILESLESWGSPARGLKPGSH